MFKCALALDGQSSVEAKAHSFAKPSLAKAQERIECEKLSEILGLWNFLCI